MIDRTTKILLGATAIGLWALLLRPVLDAEPVLAQNNIPAVSPMVVTDTGVYLHHANGNVYRLNRQTLAQEARAVYVGQVVTPFFEAR